MPMQKQEELLREVLALAEPKFLYFWNQRLSCLVPQNVLLDTGGRGPEANFVTRDLVDELGLTPEIVAPVTFYPVVSEMQCRERVTISWSLKPGDTQNRSMQCYVLPANANSTITLLGASFIRSSGVELLSEEPNHVAYVAQSQYSVTSTSRRLEA